MRMILVLCICLFTTCLHAQSLVPASMTDYSMRQNITRLHLPDSASGKKWSLDRYAAVSTSFSFFKGGSATVLSVPVGLQLTRRINNNLFAFAGVSVAPSYLHFNQAFLSNTGGKTFGMSNMYGANNFGINPRAEMGLMYVNDARTFSISGSISVERSNYPVYIPAYTPANRQSFPTQY